MQVRLDIGWIREERRGMFSLEAYVPGTRELLALEVSRLALHPSLGAFLEHASEHQRRVLLDLFDPDPFP